MVGTQPWARTTRTASRRVGCLAAFLFEEDRVLEAEALCKIVFESRLNRYGEVHILTARAALSLGIICKTAASFIGALRYLKWLSKALKLILMYRVWMKA